MREEMASSSSLCDCVCLWSQAWTSADHTLDHSCPRSIQREQIVPSLSSTGDLLYSTITLQHWKRQADVNDEPEDCRKNTRSRGKREQNMMVGRVVLGLSGSGRPEIRQEMRKENEKKCLPKLWWDTTIARLGWGREIRAEEIWKDAQIGKRGREETGGVGGGLVGHAVLKDVLRCCF